MLNSDWHIPFVESVNKLVKEKNNAVVRRYRVDLVELADLRNAIVHRSTNPNYVIAEPQDSAVERIVQIEKEISHSSKIDTYIFKCCN